MEILKCSGSGEPEEPIYQVVIMQFEDAVTFHGHTCPGLALGYRVAQKALAELEVDRAGDEELVAVVENNSCAVDAIQVVTGCTFGKGNLYFVDNGKQVYSFYRRSSDQAVRIAVKWEGPAESAEEKSAWQKYTNGDRSPEVVKRVAARKKRKYEAVMQADDDELFNISIPEGEAPPKARVYPSVRCNVCGEKVMEPRAFKRDDKWYCIPCHAGM